MANLLSFSSAYHKICTMLPMIANRTEIQKSKFADILFSEFDHSWRGH